MHIPYKLIVTVSNSESIPMKSEIEANQFMTELLEKFELFVSENYHSHAITVHGYMQADDSDTMNCEIV